MWFVALIYDFSQTKYVIRQQYSRTGNQFAKKKRTRGRPIEKRQKRKKQVVRSDLTILLGQREITCNFSKLESCFPVFLRICVSVCLCVCVYCRLECSVFCPIFLLLSRRLTYLLTVMNCCLLELLTSFILLLHCTTHTTPY